jgi:hypothetical protein
VRATEGQRLCLEQALAGLDAARGSFGVLVEMDGSGCLNAE